MMSRRRRERRAAEWLIELKTTDDVRALWPAFQVWLQEAPENRSIYRELEEISRHAGKALRSSGQLRSEGIGQRPDKPTAAVGTRCLRRRCTLFAGLAVPALIMALLLSVLTSGLALDFTWRRYESRYGEFVTVTLADGSRIHLNTWTRLRVRETALARSVILERGEALFSVAAAPWRPFTVSVGGIVVRAIGTEFSVRRQSEGVVDALVSRGSVKVVTPGTKGTSHADGSDERVVTAGQAIHIMPSRLAITNIGTSDIRRQLAWTAGMIDIDGTLAEAVETFNRYNRRKLVIVDPSIAAKHIQGLFKATDPGPFAEELQHALGIPYRVTGSASTNSEVILLGATR